MVDSSALIDEMMSHLRADDFVDTDEESQVANLYANRSVFITGATGFIGKALVEKLVRTCTKIKKIYLLVREKRGKDVKSRLMDMMQSQIFNRIRSHPDGAKLLEEKLHAIQGDITMEKFGISQEDMQLLSRDVSIVFNSAATIRFVEPIDVAVRNNIYSVSQLVQFCNQLDNLQAIVHLSTAYSNCHKRDTIYEIFYEPPMTGDQIIASVGMLRELQNSIHVYPSVATSTSAASASTATRSSDHQMDQALANGSNSAAPGLSSSPPPPSNSQNGYSMAPEESRSACEPQKFYKDALETDQSSSGNGADAKQDQPSDLLEEFARIALRRSNRPNTYTFTKAIAESYLLDLVRRLPERYLGPSGIPVAIVRPSIVGGAWREPEVGFVDNYNGATGAILSLYTGALQAMPGCGSLVADLVPVDMVVNMIISTGYFLASSKLHLNNNNNHNHNHKHEHNHNHHHHHHKREQTTKRIDASNNVKPDKGVYIFNFVSGFRNQLRWQLVTQLIRELALKYPSKFQVRMCGSYFVSAQDQHWLWWLPGVSIGGGQVNLYKIYDFLNHYLPAKLSDFCRRHLMGLELNERSSSVAVYNRIKQMTDTLAPFTSNQWLLCDNNVRALFESLSPNDRELFQFDTGLIDWSNYIRSYILGARIYTLKDTT